MMLIYTFMVCRMLSIYFKLRRAEQVDGITCKTKCAGKIADWQNCILITYFLICTVGIWTNYVLFERYMADLISYEMQTAIFASFNFLKLVYEITVGILFLTIYVVFNKETYSYQRLQDNNMCCTKLILVIMYTLYIVSTLIFDALGPFLIVQTKLEISDDDLDAFYNQTLLDFESVKITIDFLSCMLILYLLHQFGPYKQYLRKADLLSSIQKTLSSAGQTSSLNVQIT